ncbi:MAG: hypothetical protein ACFFE2_01785 [Candidatus Thorarchaeota archaeon]
MKSKRSARLGFAAAIWLVLSVAVFGTLIGIAWMSMNATADLSADVFIEEAVDDKTTTQDQVRIYEDKPYFATPTEDAIRHHRDDAYIPVPLYIGPGENPGVIGFMLDS